MGLTLDQAFDYRLQMRFDKMLWKFENDLNMEY